MEVKPNLLVSKVEDCCRCDVCGGLIEHGDHAIWLTKCRIVACFNCAKEITKLTQAALFTQTTEEVEEGHLPKKPFYSKKFEFTADNLPNCPKCDGRKLRLKTTTSSRRGHYIMCGACELEGGVGPTIGDAVESWNKLKPEMFK